MSKLKEAAQKIGKAVYESSKQNTQTNKPEEGAQKAERADEKDKEKK